MDLKDGMQEALQRQQFQKELMIAKSKYSDRQLIRRLRLQIVDLKKVCTKRNDRSKIRGTERLAIQTEA